MTYVIGAVVGLALGSLVGALKNRFIWGTYLYKENEDGEAGALYGRMLASNMTNLITLVVAFFLRNILPFDGIAFIIGVAVALTMMNKVLSIGQKKKEERRRGA